jgi:hypothetical protein
VCAICIPIGPNRKFRLKSPEGCSMRQIELLRFALDVLDRLQISYALVGSYASGIWANLA